MKFEFSIAPSGRQEQVQSMSRINDTQRESFRSSSWKHASQCRRLACRKTWRQQMTVIKSADMGDQDARRIRSVAARLNHLAGDGPDLLLSASARTWHGRVLRTGSTRKAQLFHWTGDDTSVQGCADSDWAGDRQNMKSTSGGVVTWSGHRTKAKLIVEV